MKNKRNQTMRRHWINFDIAGFSYYDGCMVLNELKPGMQLQLVNEENNKFDPYAVAVYYNDYKLGFIPRGLNEDVYKFLEMGYDNLFEVRIQKVDEKSHPERQVSAIMYILRNNKENDCSTAHDYRNDDDRCQ